MWILKMASNILLRGFLVQVLFQICLGACLSKPNEDDLETVDTDKLPLSELHDEQQPDPNSGESSDWHEWDDYEEEPGNKCNLTSFKVNNRASYLCQDGTAWSVNIEQTGDEKCTYSRHVKIPYVENEIKQTAVNCGVAQEWLEDLVQYEVLTGIPDMFLFNSRNDNENTENSPTTYEPFPTLARNK